MVGSIRGHTLLMALVAVTLLAGASFCLLHDEGPDSRHSVLALVAVFSPMPFLEPTGRLTPRVVLSYRLAPFDLPSPPPRI